MNATPATLHLLSGGAAQGLVRAVQASWQADTGVAIDGRFGAVGAMKEALLAGAPCDVMITTDSMVAALVADGRLRGDARAPLGRVPTGIAVPAGDALPDVTTPDALRGALRAAGAIYFPDPERATAGIHFAGVLRRLGLEEELHPRLRTYPNGATAMRALADGAEPGRLGCTQFTEILYTDGVRLAGALPPPFGLATVYVAAVATGAADPALAQRLVDLLAGDALRGLRARGGFEAA